MTGCGGCTAAGNELPSPRVGKRITASRENQTAIHRCDLQRTMTDVSSENRVSVCGLSPHLKYGKFTTNMKVLHISFTFLILKKIK
jgi:hypothetical protein